MPQNAKMSSRIVQTALGKFSKVWTQAFSIATHDYEAANANWTLSAFENGATILIVTNANAAAQAIATPTPGKILVVQNSSGQTVTVKGPSQAGVAVTNGTIVMLMANAAGTDFVSITTGTASLSGATIDNSVIGGVTPAAGTFTTMTAATVLNQLSKRVTTALAKTTDTALATVTGLSAALAAGATYIFDITLPVTATANGGVKVDLSTSDTLTATSINYGVQSLTAAATSAADSTALATAYGATVAAVTVLIKGTIVANAAGTLIVRGAQNASHADTTTFLANGFMNLTRIA